MYDIAVDARTERVAVPERGIAGRDDVDVPVQNQGGAIGAADGPDQAPGLGPWRLQAREVRMRLGFGQIDGPEVGVQPEGVEVARKPVLGFAFGRATSDGGNADQFGQAIQRPGCIDRPEHTLLLWGQRWHAGHTGTGTKSHRRGPRRC